MRAIKAVKKVVGLSQFAVHHSFIGAHSARVLQKAPQIARTIALMRWA